jgi:hypothetical protein
LSRNNFSISKDNIFIDGDNSINADLQKDELNNEVTNINEYASFGMPYSFSSLENTKPRSLSKLDSRKDIKIKNLKAKAVSYF